ncbi:hypothetical protein [Henriciella sp.]|uniref:hypothetical protein n=1 Tax=Henriciella sp. TaxID=1968823 RepID=UPI0026167214|nr:hypothetical protein [Henriciella sp.]
MRVSTRNILAGGAGLATLLVIGGSVAFAGGSGGGHGCNSCKPPPPPPPTYNPKPKTPCCTVGRGHKVVVPGVNVNVHGVRVNVSAESHLNVSAGASASSDVVAFASGGGGGFGGASAVATTAIDALNVEGGAETYTETVTEQVPTLEEYCVDEVSYRTVHKAVQAVCIDDKGAPHPASQVESGQSVPASYEGELFRCMAGTRMQVTIGGIEAGEASFDHGRTLSCAKGEALVYGTGGQLTCQPETPQRNCNERSLLRRYGPGIKVIESKAAEKVCIPHQRTVMKEVTREVERVRAAEAKSMVFDGGVGQGVY